MEKQALRTSAITTLKNLTTIEKQQIEDQLLEQLFASSLWKEANTIGVTISQGFEWDTKPIIEAAWEQGKTVYVPKCLPEEKLLTFYHLTTYDQLEIVYYNLLEPNPEKTIAIKKEKIDLLLVPGMLFDKVGYRIGFGGGYYDRFLTDYPNKTLSLVSNIQLVDHVPSESYDIPVHHIITEDGFAK